MKFKTYTDSRKDYDAFVSIFPEIAEHIIEEKVIFQDEERGYYRKNIIIEMDAEDFLRALTKSHKEDTIFFKEDDEYGGWKIDLVEDEE